jgi:hypothetical protein
MINREQLLEYVRTLPEWLQQVFLDADRQQIEIEDTLSEEFQLAASICDVFSARAEQYGGDPIG